MTADAEAHWARAGETAREAFAALGNETRLDVLLALWERVDEHGELEPMAFSDLYRAVGYDHPGNFSYHLKKLAPFVAKDEDGYRLTRVGFRLVRTVIAGVDGSDLELTPEPAGFDCDFCGAPAEITYCDGWLFIVCTECEGAFERGEGFFPEGTLTGAELDPAGFVDRDGREMFRTAWLAAMNALALAVEGICDDCSGRMDRRLVRCGTHDETGVCDACGTRFEVMAKFVCTVCRNSHAAPPRTVVATHPEVVAFHHEHGVATQYETADYDAFVEYKRVLMDQTQTVVSTDPLRVVVSVQHGDDELRLTLDDALSVIETAVESGATTS